MTKFSTFLLVFTVIGFVWTTQVNAQAQMQSHCVDLVEPVVSKDFNPANPDLTLVPPVRELGCFDTFSEAIRFATNGNVIIPEGTSRQEALEMVKSAQTDTFGTSARSSAYSVFGAAYSGTNRSGSSRTFISSSISCGSGVTYYVGNLGTLNNDVESAETLGGCTTMYLYDSTNYAGGYTNFNFYQPNLATLGFANRAESLVIVP